MMNVIFICMMDIMQIVKHGFDGGRVGTSQAQKAESRERIVAAAARQIRTGGLDSVSIAELMKAAGLTHGAFYAHFPSRAALLAAALERALEDGARSAQKAYGPHAERTLRGVVESYLSPAHRDGAHKGCAVPALAADVSRGDAETGRIMREQIEGFIASLAETIGDAPEARGQAIATWSSMVGAIALARLFKDDPLGDEILAATRRAILGDG